MRAQPRWLPIAPWTVCLALSLISCGDDDASAPDMDAGLHCNPLVGGVGQCYCSPSGSLGIHRCITQSDGMTGLWGQCACNERPGMFTCVEGSLLACACADGSASQRLCRASNTVDPCMCSNDTSLDSGALDSGDIDAN